MVDNILADYKTAPMDEKMRAMMVFLEKQTLRPSELGAEDARQLFAAGVSRKAAEEALAVSYVFNIHDRLADTLGYKLEDADEYMQTPKALLTKRGYRT